MIENLSKKYDVDPQMLDRAIKNIESKKVLFLTISGRIASGKDSVAPEVVERLNYKNNFHLSFALPLREEVNHVIEIIKNSSTKEESIVAVYENLKPVNYYPVIDALWYDVKSGKVSNSFQRTTSTRKALQWWGTEVRRSIDEDYWVKKAMKKSIEYLSDGTSVYVTDSRFKNEAEAITELGGKLIRLEVNPEVQKSRILARDGILPTEEALNHDSETAMNDYPFKFSVDTNTNSKEEVISAVIKMISD